MRLTKAGIEELKGIEDRRGRLTPAEVVDVARNEESALHGCFEWDDTAAAEKWRVEQARELIRRVKIIVTIEEREIRTVGYVRNPAMPLAEAGYINTLRVTKAGSKDVMRGELGALCADLQRAVGLAEAYREDIPDLAEKLNAVLLSVMGMLQEI